MRLKEKVALVTGGAHGMGAAEAKLFAKEGARVVVADVRDGDGKAVIDQITSAGGQARFVHLDVTRETEWQQAVAFAVSTFGKLDVLVNNAGISGGVDAPPLRTTAPGKPQGIQPQGGVPRLKDPDPASAE